MTWLPLVNLLMRLAAGGLLLVAGVAKLAIGPDDVFRSFLGYGVLPRQLARLSAIVLPPAETSLGVLLVLGLFTTAVAAAAGVLMALVTVTAALALIRGRRPPCGCFGRGRRLLTWRVVGRNLVIFAALVGLVLGGVS
jgi:uncharacterized membrane protein YphA (DoxX/SURF4 family)